MTIQIGKKEQLTAIRHDASKVIKDISKLSSKLRDVGLDRAEEIGAEVSRALEDEISQLRMAQGQLRKLAGSCGKAVHGTVKKQPYAFIGGALGIGCLLGMLLPRIHQRSMPFHAQ